MEERTFEEGYNMAGKNNSLAVAGEEITVDYKRLGDQMIDSAGKKVRNLLKISKNGAQNAPKQFHRGGLPLILTGKHIQDKQVRHCPNQCRVNGLRRPMLPESRDQAVNLWPKNCRSQSLSFLKVGVTQPKKRKSRKN